jgi:hypothetical protein
LAGLDDGLDDGLDAGVIAAVRVVLTVHPTIRKSPTSNAADRHPPVILVAAV